jgi:hypothetical protein
LRLTLGRRNDVERLLAAADITVSSFAFGVLQRAFSGTACGLPAVAIEVGVRAIVGGCGYRFSSVMLRIKRLLVRKKRVSIGAPASRPDILAISNPSSSTLASCGSGVLNPSVNHALFTP